MKKLLLLIFIISSLLGFSQSGDTSKKGFRKPKLITNSSTVEKLEKIKDSTINAVTTLEEKKVQEDISRNMDGLKRLQKENKSKQKNAAMLRVVIGLFVLAIFMIAMKRFKRRKRRKR